MHNNTNHTENGAWLLEATVPELHPANLLTASGTGDLPRAHAELQRPAPIPPVKLSLQATVDERSLSLLGAWLARIVRAELQALLDGHTVAFQAAQVDSDAPESFITVAELAERIGESEGITRTLLGEGLIPGARRKNPTKKNSHWVIPANAADLYTAGFYRSNGGPR